MPLSDIKIPPFRLFPTHLMEKEGPREWAKVRLLQACERLKIPLDLWPKFQSLREPPEYETTYQTHAKFELPLYNPTYQTEEQWVNICRQEFEKFLERWASVFREQVKRSLDSGGHTLIKQPRNTTPLELRYEWAARRHCLRHGWKEMATDRHSAAKIRQAALPILKELGLFTSKKRK